MSDSGTPLGRTAGWTAALRHAAMPLAYTVFTLLVFWYLWTPIEGAARTWKYDPQHDYWGDLLFQFHTASDGHFALWNPYDRGGYPLHGDPQPGMLYAPNWLIVALAAVTGSVPYVLTEVKILAHWIFGAIGMHLFLRRRGAAEPACYIGGSLFAYASPAIRYGGSTLNWTFAWVPWVLLVTDWFAEQPSVRRAVILGTTVAMTLLSGAPAVFLYMLILAVPYGLCVLWGRLRAVLLPIGAAAAVAALWVMPLVLSNLEQLPHSVRDHRDLSFITASAFQPVHLINMLVPRLGGENIYYGLLPLCCFAIWLACKPLGRAALFAVLAGLGALLALGEHADLLGSMASFAPPFGLFRVAHRYLYITTAAVAAGAGLGIGYVLALEDPVRRRELARWATWICLLITLVLATGWVFSIIVVEKLTAPRNNALGLAVIAAAASTWLVRGMLVAEGRTRMAYAWAAAGLFALDLWAANTPAQRPYLSPRPTTERDAIVAKFEGVTELEYRIYDNEYLQFRPGVRLQIRDLGGYVGDPLALSRFQSLLDLVRRAPAQMGHANVRYYLEGKTKYRVPIESSKDAKRIQKGVYELAQVAPAVMYVPRPRVVETQQQAFATLPRITPGTGAVVEGKEGAVPQGPAEAAIGQGRFVSYETDRVVVEIETAGPGLVVVAEAFYPGWVTTVDGKPAEVLPANGLFRGIPVHEAGVHRIEMQFRPRRFLMLLPTYGIAAGILVWAVVAMALARRRQRSASAPQPGSARDGAPAAEPDAEPNAEPELGEPSSRASRQRDE